MSKIPDIELISFDLCPYVQRSVITLLKKGVAHRIRYIDLDNKPDWFSEISPLGKVPVVRLDGAEVLFESAVINDYLDEVTPPGLHPADPLQKARNRAWIEVGSAQIGRQFRLFMEQDPAGIDDKLKAYIDGFDAVENTLAGPFFNGAGFSLVDAAWAPIFTRHVILDRLLGEETLVRHPNVAAWAKTLTTMEEVANSVKPDFDALFDAYLRRKGSVLAGSV